jgi:hypothetical protein
MTALVQAANASNNPILLRYDAKGGHSGIGSVNKVVEQQVDQFAFIASRLGDAAVGAVSPTALKISPPRDPLAARRDRPTPLV